MPFGPFENANLIPAASPHEAVRVSLARPFAKNLDFAANKRFAPSPRPGVNQVQQVVVTLLFDRFRYLICHFGGRSVLSGGILKDKGIIESHLVNQRSGLRIVIFGLSGEADDDIGGYSHVRALVPNRI